MWKLISVVCLEVKYCFDDIGENYIKSFYLEYGIVLLGRICK